MARYSNDPRWLDARYAGVDSDGKPFSKGTRVFYYPESRTFLTGEKAQQASRDFAAAVADESSCCW